MVSKRSKGRPVRGPEADLRSGLDLARRLTRMLVRGMETGLAPMRAHTHNDHTKADGFGGFELTAGVGRGGDAATRTKRELWPRASTRPRPPRWRPGAKGYIRASCSPGGGRSERHRMNDASAMEIGAWVTTAGLAGATELDLLHGFCERAAARRAAARARPRPHRHAAPDPRGPRLPLEPGARAGRAHGHRVRADERGWRGCGEVA